MNIGIFSVCYNGYGKFAVQWCSEIAKSTVSPSQVTIALFGDDHGLAANDEIECKKILPQLKILHGGERTNMGSMRNVAVEATHTEWIQLVSIDDILLPLAIEEFSKHDNKDVDVIACAYIQEFTGGSSRIWGTPETFDVKDMLNWRDYWLAPYSPFRRSLWEERPYVDCEYPNYLFTFDLAKAGARFARVDSLCVRYIKHAMSHSSARTKAEQLEIEKMLDTYAETTDADIIKYRLNRLKKLVGGKKMPDIYQKRYLEHQEAKKNRKATEEKKEYSNEEILTVLKVMNERRSQRIFNGVAIKPDSLDGIMKAASLAPSSCNRKAISIKKVQSDKSKEDLGRLLVGGKGWANKADTILLLLANMVAYKSPAEVDFMPYLDAGFVAENIYLMCEALSIGACFVNPNVRENDIEEFNSLFIPDGHKFCGAMVLGSYDKREAKRHIARGL